MYYGILKSAVNTGKPEELASVFTAPLTIGSNQPGYSQDTLNLRRIAGSQNVQRWEISAGVAPTVGEPAMLLLTTKYAYHRVLSVRMPQIPKLVCTTASATVANTTQAGTNMLEISGANKLVTGEFVNIGDDPKVYLVADGGSGGLNVEVFPPLRRAIPAGAVIKTGYKVTLKAKLSADSILGISFSDGLLSDPGQYTFIEDLQ